MDRGRAAKLAGLIFYICILSFVLIGCANVSSYKKSSDPTQIPSLEPAALLKFSDVPVPSGFRIVSEESYVFQSSNFRAGLLKYAGKATGDQISVFFKEQMPIYNWHTINIVEYGKRILNFDKDLETCIVTIDEKGNNSSITISLAPKSQIAPTKKSDKPIK